MGRSFYKIKSPRLKPWALKGIHFILLLYDHFSYHRHTARSIIDVYKVNTGTKMGRIYLVQSGIYACRFKHYSSHFI
jgi:hypothetical protein